MRSVGTLFILLSLGACLYKETGPSSSWQPHYALQDSIAAVAADWEIKGLSLLKKTASPAGKKVVTESYRDEAFEAVLKPFYAADINKPALLGKYAVDTLTRVKGMAIIYRAKDPREAVRLVQVFSIGGRFQGFAAVIIKENMLFDSRQVMILDRDKGFFFQSYQKNLISEPRQLNVHASLRSTPQAGQSR